MSEKDKESKGPGALKKFFGGNKSKSCCCGMKIEEVKEEKTEEKAETAEKK